jgi:hypothetical protein
LKAFGWMKILCFLCLGALEKFNIFLMCTELERVREENLIFQKLCPISAPSVQNWPNCGCRFWPFLSYAAKKSAKWQHCFHCFLGGGGGGGGGGGVGGGGGGGPPAGVTGIAARREWDGLVPGMMLPCAKGHGGPGQQTGLPIGCGQGRETDRYMECCRLAQRDMAGRVGRHRAILSRDLKITKKRRKSAITLFSRLMSPPRFPVRTICSSVVKPRAN